ncbi:phosphatase PAP2 family protein [Rhodopirellula sp. P2]|uniref:phosphatase PAP2 family protein n=1 Tax=Rhodopirellula sp. P2 TaxID=2127060 RepID=UPI0023684D03|nr:phosphatase PAP2 family protein [Rhodopirellula sp. P2]WDQ15919.1 phosphatase PAP2 family protein [Rhodopirellula sp. P2]
MNRLESPREDQLRENQPRERQLREHPLFTKTSTTNDAVTLYRPVTLFYMAAMTMMLVPMMTLVDVNIASYFRTAPLPAELDSALELSLVLSHGYGVFVILLAILLMAPKRRWHLPRLVTLALGGGAIATIAKMFVIRPRPSNLNLNHAGHDSAWLWAFDWDLSEVASFDSAMRAFPSGHVVTATAMLIGLWVVVPRGRLLFIMVWMGVLANRVNTSAHFTSDVCGGVAFGLFWSYVCFHPRLLGNLFDKMVPEHGRRTRGETSDSSEAIPSLPPQINVGSPAGTPSFPMHASPIHASQMSATEQYEALASKMSPNATPTRPNTSDDLEQSDQQTHDHHNRQQDFGDAGERAA